MRWRWRQPVGNLTSTTTPSSIGGTVAVGDALAGANVTLIDSTGKSVTTTSDAGGNYSISITGFTAPFVRLTTTVAAPLTSDGTSACSFPALTTGVSRLVQLNWGAEGVSYYNIWKYND
ncbi:carboxypeptidase-like regulatory domain-containing protein [Paraburkholderia sp. CNPSo 3281]|uniref:carboxypeptidase-like regulatory domain-containing protein n=1 Tax=Paraburkholderia sp. CNPSo 3281 TaxID=2940933 RepID=UPI0020B7B1EB|nr:carboxypeptidase-like regulatory domain-containing protein [Paraburkholderia sp. CNPSo 3281]MCP3716719.1 carboxypeptidase-like regulatory domain-containing protein [Paraburkholderia sp. CNPSo 3281]